MMSNVVSPPERFWPLVESACLGTISEEESGELQAILRGNPAVQQLYLEYCRMHSELRTLCGVQRASDVVLPTIASPAFPPVVAILNNGMHSGDGYLSSGWPVAYLIATIVFAVGLTVAAVTRVSHPGQQRHIAGESPNPQSLVPDPSPKSPVVGRITGMVDCQWEDSEVRAQGSDRGQWPVASGQKPSIHQPLSTIHLGDTFALKSGLLEITYDTGACVILQGPVTYKVESSAGGFLSVGKLTAKLEKKAVSGQRSVVSGQKSSSHQPLATSHSADPQSLIPNPSSLATNHYPLFTIKTPTAIVTDLGTEFGVEVDQQGQTQSHVFRGLVRVQSLGAGGKPEGDARMLHENESLQVDRNGRYGKTAAVPTAQSSGFTRAMPQGKKTFDLVDVVAGGDGFSGRRNRGIDPTNGRTTDTNAGYMVGDGTYHRVEGMPFVDGVFIPHGRTDPVQIDSAGHTFAGFGNANNKTANCVWAGGVIPTNPPYAISTRLDNVDYARRGRGLLFMHSNKGITFDLNAIRAANPKHKLSRFRSTAGNSEVDSQDESAEHGDLWVFVDGQIRFQHQKTNYYNGAIPIDIPIGDGDRFLTLAATDGGRPIEYNWIIFGDPRLELVQTTSDAIRP